MQDHEATPSRSERIAAEHRAVRARALALEQALERHEGRAELATMLRGLEQHLRAHFRLEEEQGGPVPDLARRSPASRRREQELVAAHTELLARVSELARELGTTRGEPPDAVLDAARHLLADLAAHEAEEERLADALVSLEAVEED